MEDQKHRTQYLSGSLLICLIGAVLIWHCRLSFCQSDESFYLALAHRWWSGDRMILDEWNITQFYSPIILPFYALYRIITPEGTGVYLYARIVYVLFSTIISILFYLRCCKSATNRLLPFVAAVLTLLYSRANICGPSYYNLCLQFVVAAILFLWRDGNNDSLCKPVLAGFFLALAVLCNPYFSIIVFCSLIILAVKRETRNVFCKVLAGVILTALVYIIYLMHFDSLLVLLRGIPQVLKSPISSDPLMTKIIQNGKALLQYVSAYVFPVSLIGCLAVTWCWKQERQLWKVATSIYLLLCLLLIGYTAYKAKTSICFIITVPFTILIFPKVIRAFFFQTNYFALFVFAAGVALAIVFFLASNTGADAMTIGTCLSTAGGVLLLFDNGTDKRYNSTDRIKSYSERVICVCICLLLTGVFSAHRFLGIYRDAPISQLTHKIERGPAAGLYTTAEHAEEYNSILNEIIKIHKNYSATSVLFSRNLPWAYLASDWACANFTVWSTKLADPRIEKYYQTHREPDIIFVFDESVAGYETAPFNNHTKYNIFNQNEFAGPFYDYLLETYKVIDKNELVTVYGRLEPDALGEDKRTNK